MKRIISIISVIMLLISVIPSNETQAGADITKPIFESIDVDKTEATIGDTVKVRVKATDDVEVKRVSVNYLTPITQKNFWVTMEYNTETKYYEGTIPITSNTESGQYKVDYLAIYDTSDNSTVLQERYNPTKLAPGTFSVSGTDADITKPIFESIDVDKTEATIGDTVKVRVKATDDVEVKRVSVNYLTPITQKNFWVTMEYNTETNYYEGTIPITSNTESGQYIVDYLAIYDTSDNSTVLQGRYDSTKLQTGTFRVFTESNPPTFTSLSIDQTKVESGDQVGITVNATDDSSLQEAVINYISPVSNTIKSIQLNYSSINHNFIGNFDINQDTEVGIWKVDSIHIKDTNENTLIVKANETDLTNGHFTVIKGVEPIDAYIVKTNESWSNKTINTDVYITPHSRLTINSNVTINGDIYVLGGLRSYGGLSVNGSLIANSIYLGYYTPSNGQAVLSGSNSISSMVATNRVLTEVPLKIYDTPLIKNGDKINLTGATLPFVKVTINGKEVPLKSNGTFRLEEFPISGNGLEVLITDSLGYKYSYSYQVEDIHVEEITKNSKTIKGRTLPNMKVVISDNKIDLGSVNTDENGYFEVSASNLIENSTLVVKVYNSEGILKATKEVVVKDTTPPSKPTVNEVGDNATIITGTSEAKSIVYVKVGTKELGNSQANSSGEFSISIPNQNSGTELTLYAVDAAGNKSESTKVVVQDKSAPAAPEVDRVTNVANEVTGKAEPGTTVTVKSNSGTLGKNTTDQSGAFSVQIPMQKAGTELKVTATDDSGNVSTITKASVEDGLAPEQPTITSATEKEVVGTAEPLSNIIVKVGSKVIGTGKTSSAGEFSVLYSDQEPGSKLSVIATDDSGNSSEVATIIISKKVLRISGKDRYLTAIEVSKQSFPNGTETVLIVRGNDFPDALAATPLAYKLDAPILSTPTNNLTAATITEINRLGAKKAIIIGGNNAVSGNVETQLKKLGITVERIRGVNRYETASKIAQRINGDKTIIAYGKNFADALAIAPYAARNGIPILLSDSNKLPPETKNALRGHTVVVGGTAAIDNNVFNSLPNPIRLSGSDRYSTNAAIIKHFHSASSNGIVATGRNYADALTGSILAAKQAAPILLVNTNRLPEPITNVILKYDLKRFSVLGGTSAIDNTVIEQLNLQ